MRQKVIAPGGTIGIIGGGQLGRMTALAAAGMGYRCHIFCPEPDSPAAQVSAAATVADYTDKAALAAFADAVDVVTFEFENIPHEAVQTLAAHVPVRPNWESLHITQQRLREKDFLNGIGAKTAPYRRVDSANDLPRALAEIGYPAVLKSARFGYDGKGQVLIRSGDDPAAAWAAMGGDLGILEGFVNFEREVSVAVARGIDGCWAAFDVVENIHRNHILHQTLAPARVPMETAATARALAGKIVEKLDLVGLLTVEMFVTAEGTLLVNELAPRPHNSGHWTIDACPVSQFGQFVRAVCGLPLGPTDRHSDAEMTNLLGDDINKWSEIVAEPAAHLHLYGKAAPRPGRKMGHVTRLRPRT
ncbi:MAG: 5-(carboxyamino)imidazole ribonucleotide synthase [Magnetospiraceae bacterium]